ncbi:MAG: hypothetical protein COB49_00635 [Alphaproteobacteria bacterium]|nr:MAG: hypothetical protein COB49_00635 [Alphaproteobacteria bacterium]
MPEKTSLIEKAVAMDSTIGQRYHPPQQSKKSPTTPTFSGRDHYLLTPLPRDINWRDIAAHLAKINRYTGATPLPYSVAQHCVIMCDLSLPELKPYALLHDAHEAYINDLSAPFKAALQLICPQAIKAIKHIEYLQDTAIYAAANLTYPVPDYIKRRIKELDLAMASAEIEQLLCRPARDNVPAAKTIIRVKSWGDAEDQFMARLEQWVFPHIRINDHNKTPPEAPKG